MNIAGLSIRRPIFITCIVAAIVVMGIISWSRLGVDLYPDVTEPGLMIITMYPGAAPEEIESLVTKPLEEEMSTLSGLKHLTSTNYEGLSVIIAEFSMGSDMKYLIQRTTELVGKAKSKLPDGIEDPQIQPFSMSDIPIMKLALMADLSPADLYDLANDNIKHTLEQVDDVGTVNLLGGTKREIQIELDRNRLNEYQLPAVMVANQLQSTGMNIPIGKYKFEREEMVFRTIGVFENLDQIRDTVMSFSGDFNSSVTVKSLGEVKDGVEDAKNLAFLVTKNKSADGKNSAIDKKKCIFFDIIKQSSTNTVAISDRVQKQIQNINESLKGKPGNPRVILVYDSSKIIRASIEDVVYSMLIGILLTIIVVYLFLGSARSTIITCIAIPNSLLGALIIMYTMGFTINVITLLALSLTIGLLVDDAIVVRENIFHKLQSGLNSFKAAELGTNQVMLAVIATTLTLIAVFLPIGFLKGVVGMYLKEFGFTVVFAVAVSLFDGLTVAPFLSAYFAGSGSKSNFILVKKFDTLQNRINERYGKFIKFSVERPLIIILISVAVFAGSIGAASFVKSTFMPGTEDADFTISIKLPPGTSLDGTGEVVKKIEDTVVKIPEFDFMSVVVGNDQGESNVASLNIFMVPFKQRTRSADALREDLRKMMEDFKFAKPSVNLYNMFGGEWKPFMMNISGENLDELNAYAAKLLEKLKTIPDLTEIELSSEIGKPEFQIKFDSKKMQAFGITTRIAGTELRYHIAGDVVGKLHQNGKEYDIRLRLKPEQRNLKSTYHEARVPNMQYRMIPLSAVSTGEEKLGPTQILRRDRERAVQISANFAVGGAAGNASDRVKQIIEKELPLPKGVTYSFWGDAEALSETSEAMMIAFVLAIVFMFLILASLYESFITPVTILLAIPPALSGAFFALLIFNKTLDMFSMIGMIMLVGLVVKNSILLIDFAVTGVNSGLTRKEAIYNAGVSRLRPILMTSFSTIAGTLPIAFGLGVASKQRSSMGIAILGGVIVSTVITLLLVPAIFEYIDVFREFIESRFRPKAKKEYFDETALVLNDGTDDVKSNEKSKRKKGLS